MEDAEIHESMTRLYKAAVDAKLIPNKDHLTAIANKLNVSQQVVGNWQKRGIADGGLLQVQAELGINATYLKTGEGPVYLTGSNDPPEPRGPLTDIQWRDLQDAFRRAAAVIEEVNSSHPEALENTENREGPKHSVTKLKHTRPTGAGVQPEGVPGWSKELGGSLPGTFVKEAGDPRKHNKTDNKASRTPKPPRSRK